MNRTKVITILALFLTMKARVGQPAASCVCSRDAPIFPAYCNTRGCSNVTNRYCNDGTFDGGPYSVVIYNTLYYFVGDGFPVGGHYFFACNCPGFLSTAIYNSYYGYLGAPGEFGPFVPYDHTTCTDFGGNARDVDGNIPFTARHAVECCNFCCGRNDSYPTTTTTITITSGGPGIILDKSLYLSGLTLLIPSILKIN